MVVSLINDGPYTILVDTDELESPRRGGGREGGGTREGGA